MNFSQNSKKISENGFLHRITLIAQYHCVPNHHATKMKQKLIKSKKSNFQSPRQTKNVQYLGPRESDAKMHILYFVITRHFRAACQFLSDSYGPVSRTWIFSLIFLYIIEKKYQNFWKFYNVIKIVIFNQFLHFRCLNPLIRPRQTQFCH